MKYLVSIFAILSSGVAITLLHLFGVEPLVSAITSLAVVDAKGLAAVGCFVAMFQFAPKDYLRRAWGLLTIGQLLLVEAEMVLAVLSPAVSPETLAFTRGALLIGANLAAPVAMVLFARALAAAGLDLAGTPRSRFIVNAVAVLIALLVAGPNAAADIRALAAGDLARIANVASDVGDIVSLMLVAPLVYNVVTLRGGTLLWPFVMLAASRLSWLVYDGIELAGQLSGHTPMAAAVKHGLRIAALLFLFVAGLAQRWALTRAAGGTVHAAELNTQAA